MDLEKMEGSCLLLLVHEASLITLQSLLSHL